MRAGGEKPRMRRVFGALAGHRRGVFATAACRARRRSLGRNLQFVAKHAVWLARPFELGAVGAAGGKAPTSVARRLAEARRRPEVPAIIGRAWRAHRQNAPCRVLAVYFRIAKPQFSQGRKVREPFRVVGPRQITVPWPFSVIHADARRQCCFCHAPRGW